MHSGRRRVATADVEIGGVTIRAGDGVIVAGEAANRDPAVFDAPDELDIHRSARNHVAFGFGIHQCLEQPLARLELQIAYPALLRRFPTLAVAAEVADLPFRHDMLVYGLHALPVTW
ncbi:cytochrome P450 [Pseudonocardia sp. GCM10023141]|uniref:cytochrome P450 n=1 Tax=Pseudonocardia sp. GCM10023141 TaxID=3252653 RepID=UPI0036061068